MSNICIHVNYLTKSEGAEHNYGYSDIHIYLINESSWKLRSKARVSAFKCCVMFSLLNPLSLESLFSSPLFDCPDCTSAWTEGSAFCWVANGSFWQPPTHRDGRLDLARLTKSPSCNCTGCSQSACLLCRTCGGCCRRTLCQTAETDGGEDEGGDDCGKDTDGLQRETLVFIMSAVTERFHLWNIKLLVRVLLRGRRTWEIWTVTVVLFWTTKQQLTFQES